MWFILYYNGMNMQKSNKNILYKCLKLTCIIIEYWGNWSLFMHFKQYSMTTKLKEYKEPLLNVSLIY